VKKWQIAVVVVTVLAVAVAALFGGRAWGHSAPANDTAQAQSAGQGPGNGNFPGMPGGDSAQPDASGRDGGNMTSGTIIAADDTSITIQTTGGSTKIVLVSASTSITKTVDAGPSDLVTGENVVVAGTVNDDNSVTASSIVLGSGLGFGGAPGGGAPPAGGAPAPADGSTTPPAAE
jgi:hypothetical protein